MTVKEIKKNPQLFREKYLDALEKAKNYRAKFENTYSALQRSRANEKALEDAYAIMCAKYVPEVPQADDMKRKIEHIASLVLPHYPGVNMKSVYSKSRQREIVEARQIIMYFIREKYRLPWKLIGKLFNGRDHSTCIWAYEQVENHSAVEKDFRDRIASIAKHIKNL